MKSSPDQKHPPTNAISLISQYKFYDMLALRKSHICRVRIPDTITIDKGFIREWLFNSTKDHSHPILKKHHENLSTMNVIKHFCAKLGYGKLAEPCKTIYELHA